MPGKKIKDMPTEPHEGGQISTKVPREQRKAPARPGASTPARGDQYPPPGR